MDNHHAPDWKACQTESELHPGAVVWHGLPVGDFGTRLDRAMVLRKVSAAVLAKEIGVYEGSVSRWLSGERGTPKADYVSRTARFLKVRYEWLAEGMGSMVEGGAPDASEPMTVTEAVKQFPGRWSQRAIDAARAAFPSVAPRGGVERLLTGLDAFFGKPANQPRELVVGEDRAKASDVSTVKKGAATKKTRRSLAQGE